MGQSNYILEMPLRRLTKFSRLELEKEQDELRAVIADLTDILENDKRLRKVVGQELTDVANQYGDDRRSQLLSDDGIISAALPVPLEVTDDPCFVLMSATGLLARTTGDIPLEFAKKRTSHDTIRSMVRTTARGDVGIVTSFGRVIRQSVVNLPALAEGAAMSAAGSGSGGIESTSILLSIYTSLLRKVTRVFDEKLGFPPQGKLILHQPIEY